MDQDDYAKTWSALFSEKVVLIDRRTSLETELSEISMRISHLDEVLNHLAPLAGVPAGENLSDLGITDAIRHVLQRTEGYLSASELRETLVAKGFDLSGHSAPMSSIYKVLSRLTDDSGEVEREKGDGGRVSYRWRRPESEITDDDIPF